MSKVAIIGDKDSVYGFAAIGLDTYYADTKITATEILKDLCNSENYVVIFVTEELAALISDEIEKHSTDLTPAVILIPGINGNTGEGMRAVKRCIEKAVGSDILN